MLVAFVCTGNIAGRRWQRRLPAPSTSADGVSFASAGTSAVSGVAASPWTVRVIAEVGIGLGDHTSRPLSDIARRRPDLIYAMTRDEASQVCRAPPGLASRVGLLDPDGADIADPDGRGIEEYVAARDQIAKAVERRSVE